MCINSHVASCSNMELATLVVIIHETALFNLQCKNETFSSANQKTRIVAVSFDLALQKNAMFSKHFVASLFVSSLTEPVVKAKDLLCRVRNSLKTGLSPF